MIKKENLNLQDKIDFKLKGHLVFRDPLTGKIVHEQDNLILLRSRSYILELLFGLVADSSHDFVNDKSRTVCLFKIGQGGADITTSPFESIAPKFGNTDLYDPIPFIIEDPNKNLDPTKLANPSFVEALTEEQKMKYYLPVESPDGSIRYFGKVFEEDTTKLQINKATGEAYVRLTLAINPDEARGFIYNELGLVLAHYDEKTNTYSNEELFSHITIDSDSLKSLQRGILIEYYVYA